MPGSVRQLPRSRPLAEQAGAGVWRSRTPRQKKACQVQDQALQVFT